MPLSQLISDESAPSNATYRIVENSWVVSTLVVRTYIPTTQNISVEVSVNGTLIASDNLNADSVGAISYQFTVPLDQKTGMIAVSAGAAEPISVEVVQ